MADFVLPQDILWMQEALQQAQMAADLNEVPVGAVLVHAGEVIAKAHNRRETWADPLAHAELLVITEAAKKLKRWRLLGCTLFVTLEPCPMCAGALVNARIDRLVFGAYDKRGGGVGSVFNIAQEPRLNHQPVVCGGLLATESAALLQAFFAARRKSSPMLKPV